jgi:hypothetical protein
LQESDTDSVVRRIASARNLLSGLDLARFAAALLGAAFGALVALAIACFIFPPPAASFDPASLGVLNWAKSWAHPKPREMGFYALTLLLGSLGGWLGAHWQIAGRRASPWSAAPLLLLVPVINAAVAPAMTGGPTVLLYDLAATATLFVIAFTIRYAARSVSDECGAMETTPQPLFHHLRSRGKTALILAGSTGLIAAFLLPLSARRVAEAIGFDIHQASFMIGPATYSFGRGLIPGIDYFTQYSVGTPWLFSFFLAPTASETMIQAVWFVVAEMIFFHVTLFCFLWWFLRGWGWALVVTVAVLMTQFTTSSPLYAPSSTSARYPLLALVACLFVLWVKRALSLPAAAPLAVALAGALFLNTETGVYASAAVAMAAVVAVPSLGRSVGKVAFLGALTFLFFMLLSLIAFGSGALDYRYLWFLIEPMILYAGGLGAWPIEWIGGLHWLYNIVAPGVALASIGWVAVTTREPALAGERTHLAALAMISLIGLFMSAKFVNMSIVALWQVNSLGFLIISAWWARALVDRLGDHPAIFGQISPRMLTTAAMAVLLGTFLAVIEDPRNPNLYTFASYRTHPSLVNALLGGAAVYDCPGERTGCTSQPIVPEDVALITRLTRPGERVALLFMQDWAYLIEARRPSKFHFLPSPDIFTERQLRDSLRDIDLIFLPREPAADLGVTNPQMVAIVVPMLRQGFSVVDQGAALLAWRRNH